ncbi:unnamed protein product [Rhodiola kirilowii]
MLLSSSSSAPLTPISTLSHSQFPKPSRIQMIRAATAYRESVDSDIDAHLKKVVTIRPPFEVFQPMHQLVFSTPINIASALCVAACEVVGGHRSNALSAAAALHLMHVATSAHENLLMGNNKVHHKYPFGPNIELLTGDGVVPLGFELLAGQKCIGESSDDDFTGRVVRVIVEITRAVGSRGVVDGQFRKYASNHSKHDLLCHERQLIELKLRGKRSEFYACGAACGAILGGGGEEEIERLRRFGLYMGMINQTVNEEEEELYWRREKVMELRNLGLKELEDFDEGKIEFVSSVVDSLFAWL